MNCIGMKFGKLTVIGECERKGYVRCKCDCGNVKDIRKSNVTLQHTRSCGCIQKMIARQTGASNIAFNSSQSIENNKRYNTNFHIIESKKLPINNKSGVKGVYFDANRHLYEAYLSVHGKRIYLGRYAEIQDAVQARKDAEEKYFAPLIEQKKGGSTDGHERTEG